MTTPTDVQTDAQNRVARTGAQAVVPAAIITIASWVVMRFTNVGDVPAAVWGAVQALLTVAVAWLMNRKALAGPDPTPPLGGPVP